jgi:hypothetical protein
MRRSIRIAPFVLALLALLPLVRRVESIPLYAARERLPCQTCHVDPNGGGARNEFGFAYAKNRHSLAAEEGKPWGEPTLANRVGESMPLIVGLNLREMLIATTSAKDDSLDRAGFFQMESALHLSFQPHRLLSANLSVNAFEGAAEVSDAFAILSGGPGESYLKLGRFRNPFGLRMDDHTVATRNGFLDFTSGSGGFATPIYLPYDPRAADQGLEAGASLRTLWARAAFTNGGSSPFFGSTRAQATSIKIGGLAGPYQGAVSFYDDFNSDPAAFNYRRATRWSYYGMLGFRPVTLLGEIGAGTDELPTGVRRNSLAGFGEVDWTPAHPWNVRVRYDWGQSDRSSDDSTHERWALETDWTPVPFAELRLVLRRILHEDDALDDESQAYVQGHFSY